MENNQHKQTRIIIGAIVYWSQKFGSEFHTADCIPKQLGFFQTKQQLKKAIKEKVKEDFILPIRIKICER
jgi:hypothetical protein